MKVTHEDLEAARQRIANTPQHPDPRWEHARLRDAVVEAAKVMYCDFTWEGEKSDQAINGLMEAVEALDEFESTHGKEGSEYDV